MFSWATGLSVLLCIATTAMWGMSHLEAYSLSQLVYLPVRPGVSTSSFHPLATQRFRMVYVTHGRLLLAQSYRSVDFVSPSGGWTGRTKEVVDTGSLGVWTREVSPRRDTFSRVVIPLWILAVAFAVLPVAWKRSRRRDVPGLCQFCGYDLRATPERCPERGKTPAEKVIIST